MIHITVTSIKADSSEEMERAGFVPGETAYYIIRESGKRISEYYHSEYGALIEAWEIVKKYGLTLVEPW